jgi:ubiquinone biosynthesis protein UbiJ
VRDSGRQVQKDVTEYLQEEAGLLARREQVEHLMNDIDEVRSDVERLAQRIRRLGNAL